MSTDYRDKILKYVEEYRALPSEERGRYLRTVRIAHDFGSMARGLNPRHYGDCDQLHPPPKTTHVRIDGPLFNSDLAVEISRRHEQQFRHIVEEAAKTGDVCYVDSGSVFISERSSKTMSQQSNELAEFQSVEELTEHDVLVAVTAETIKKGSLTSAELLELLDVLGQSTIAEEAQTMLEVEALEADADAEADSAALDDPDPEEEDTPTS